MKINPLLWIDAYKLGHMLMYPQGTEVIYINNTPRSTKYLKKAIPGADSKIVAVGTIVALTEIVEAFNELFFKAPQDEVIDEVIDVIQPFLGGNSSDGIREMFEALHDLGYLPIHVKSLPEGLVINPQIPVMTITNTLPMFSWLPGFMETMISNNTWKISTNATIARYYYKLFDKYSELTCDNNLHLPFQGHDFSARGMSCTEDSIRSGIGHLTQFMGTDTVGSAAYVKQVFDADDILVGCSVPATEHAVMCLGSAIESEEDTFRRLMKMYPKGILSIVSDTWDFWDTIYNKARNLKDDILARQEDDLGFAKIVFRPDTGNPEDVICGLLPANESSDEDTPEQKGALRCLWEIFGGSINEKGYKVLNPKVGLIYGDSITPQRAEAILAKMATLGFASSNVVFGIGSYTYNYSTRDTLGYAIKATYCEIYGKGHDVYKAPKTDAGKNSMKGLLYVGQAPNGEIYCEQQVTKERESQGLLTSIFKDGFMLKDKTPFEIVRRRAKS